MKDNLTEHFLRLPLIPDYAVLIDLAQNAGEAVMDVYLSGDFGTERKGDGSPVTKADLKAEAIIRAGLSRLTPDYPIISEEQYSADAIPAIPKGEFWLVDPLDGTREFLAKNDEFTVNVALVCPLALSKQQETGLTHLAYFGIIYAPALGELYFGGPTIGSWELKLTIPPVERKTLSKRQLAPLSSSPSPASPLSYITSRRHKEDDKISQWVKPWRLGVQTTLGSSLKFCHVAAGKADIYPRPGRTMEWDTAAGDAILGGVAGEVLNDQGYPLGYGKRDFINPSFLARNWQN